MLDFDEFLLLKGCKRGRHLFVGAAKTNVVEEELVECRMDHCPSPVALFSRGKR